MEKKKKERRARSMHVFLSSRRTAFFEREKSIEENAKNELSARIKKGCHGHAPPPAAAGLRRLRLPRRVCARRNLSGRHQLDSLSTGRLGPSAVHRLFRRSRRVVRFRTA